MPQVRAAIEGATARLNGNGRLVVRPSGTEPVIRVMAEGDDLGLIEEIVDQIAGARHGCRRGLARLQTGAAPSRPMNPAHGAGNAH